MKARFAVIPLIFLFASQANSYPMSPCEKLQSLHAGRESIPLDGRKQLINEILKGNATFPLMNAIVIMRLMVAYLTQPILAADLAKEPDPKEVETMAFAMNRLHKLHSIGHRSAGHPELTAPSFAVSNQRIWDLMNDHQRVAAIKLVRLTDMLRDKILGNAASAQWAAQNMATLGREAVENYALLDQIFITEETSAVAAALRSLGKGIDAYFNSDKFKSMSDLYLKDVRQTLAAGDTNGLRIKRQELLKVVETDLKQILEESLPELRSEIPAILSRLAPR